MKRRPFASLAFATLFVAFVAGGCNGLLGNEEGKLGQGATGADASVDASTDTVSTTPETSTSDGAKPPPPDAGISCPNGKKLCVQYQACVDADDVNFGCGNPDCAPCNTDNASDVDCAPGTTSIVCKPTCNPGFRDCNNDGSCETEVTTAAACGECNIQCSGAAPLCARAAGNTYACTSSCPPGTQQCAGGTACIDTQTDPNHCGSCSAAPCAEPKNGAATCDGGTCGTRCNVLSHLCGGECKADSDVTACGVGCVDCNAQAPPNATGVACQDGACTWSGCKGLFRDCDSDLHKGLDGTGCELDTSYDNANCGACNYSCGNIILPQFRPGPPIIADQCCNGICTPSGQSCPIAG